MTLCQHGQRWKVIKLNPMWGGNKVVISIRGCNTGFNVSYPKVFKSLLSSEVNNGMS
jgi:hypothetical protein